MRRAIWFSALLLAIADCAVQAQQTSQDYYYEPAPSLSQRFQNLRKNLLGGPNDQQLQQQPQQQPQQQQPQQQQQKPVQKNPRAMQQAPQSRTGTGSPRQMMQPKRPPAAVANRPLPPKVDEQPSDVLDADRTNSGDEPADPPPPPAGSSHRRTTSKNKAAGQTESEVESRKIEFGPVVDDDRPMSSRRRTSSALGVPNTARSQKPTPPPEDEEATQRTIPAETRPLKRADDTALLMVRNSPQISVETAGPRRITVGKEAPYLIRVQNTGDMAANDLTVLIQVPDWAQVVGAQASLGTTGPGGPQPGDGFQWKIGSLPARSQQELALKIVPRKSQAFELQVRWVHSPTTTQAMVEVEEPKLQMAVVGPSEVVYGQQQVYKLSIMNPGTGSAENVTLYLLPINPGDGTTATHRLGTLAAGASKSVEVELTARQAGRIAIKAEATAEGDLKCNVAQEVFVRRARLQVGISGPKFVYAGTPASYELRVKNAGDAPAGATSVAAILPPQTEVLASGQGGQFDSIQSQIAWQLDSLAVGAEQVFSFKCAMRTSGANRLEAMAQADGDLKDTNLVTTQVLAVADLVLDVSDSPGPIPVGQEMFYEVHIKNRGTSAAEGVGIVAFFSEGLDPIGAEGQPHEARNGTVLFQPLAQLPPGEQVTLKIKARAATAGNHRVRVELQCQALGVHLTSEDTTLFYGDDGLPVSAAPRSLLPQGQ